jgi:tripartite-type tricarboxylate transporter receptor subunit TctC
MFTRRSLMGGAGAGVIASSWNCLSQARAQVFSKTVRIVVGFPAGGGTDVLARILAEKLQGRFASAAVVDNRPGGAARIAVEYVKNAEADGSVMLFTPDFPMTVYPYSFRSLNYDPLRDFTPVGPAATSTLALSAGPALPPGIKSLSGFVQWCRDNPASATYATTAAGGTPHFTGVLLSQEARVPLTPVHYRGGSPALQDLIGGHVASSINPIGETLPFAKAGSLRVLAVTSARRSSFLPEVPTMKESGYSVVIEDWLGVLVPSKTPSDIVSKLNLAIKDAFSAPDTLEKLTVLGNEPAYQTAADFAVTIRTDLERWGPIVKASGFLAD